MFMIYLTLLLLVGSCLGDMNKPRVPCSSLKGVWFNELGSKMTIKKDEKGVLEGEYQTAVSSKPPLPPPSPLVGFSSTTDQTDPSLGPANALFGATVTWKKFNSVTSWTGQCYVSSGQEILDTMWILASRVDKSSELWGANRVGKNTFTRTPQQTSQCKEDDSATRIKY